MKRIPGPKAEIIGFVIFMVIVVTLLVGDAIIKLQ